MICGCGGTKEGAQARASVEDLGRHRLLPGSWRNVSTQDSKGWWQVSTQTNVEMSVQMCAQDKHANEGCVHK